MLQILIAIAPLFLIIFASAFFQKFKDVGKDWGKVLNQFALKIGLPALIFTVLAKTHYSFATESSVIIGNSLFLLFNFALAFAVGKILRLKKEKFATLFICFAFGNIAYIGIPLLTQIFSTSILPRVSLIIAVYLFWIFTIGIGYLDYSKEKDHKHVFKNILKHFYTDPLLLSVILGLLAGGFQIPVPAILMKSLDMLSASVTPVVLVVIGLFIGNSKIGKLKEWTPVLYFTIFTLMGLPAIFYFGAMLFGFSPTVFTSSIIEAGMPLAITPFALADKYKLDKKFIARSIVLSTILSALTLPIWINILG